MKVTGNKGSLCFSPLHGGVRQPSLLCSVNHVYVYVYIYISLTARPALVFHQETQRGFIICWLPINSEEKGKQMP